MKVSLIALVLLIAGARLTNAQAQGLTPAMPSKAEQQIIDLSKTKWNWMADKNVDSLNVLFNPKSVFVHMGGSWGKTQELSVIKSGGIWYKKAEVYSTSVNILAIQLSF